MIAKVIRRTIIIGAAIGFNHSGGKVSALEKEMNERRDLAPGTDVVRNEDIFDVVYHTTAALAFLVIGSTALVLDRTR